MRWLIGGGVAVLVVLILAVAVGPLGLVGGGGAAASPSPSVAPSAAASASARTGAVASHGPCPTAQPPALPAGETRTVSLITPDGTIAIKVHADLSPIAAGNFVALATCGYYDGTVFHRVVPQFVIQGGDPTGTGTGGPGYTIKDEPVTATYSRGTVAMARTAQPDSVGSQFFIVLDDTARSALASANTYQIIGTVMSGMDTVDAIASAAGGLENPANPVAITTATVANP
jgi:cyclophilin family peptidyl-prolyl cis-trans isomerase